MFPAGVGMNRIGLRIRSRFAYVPRRRGDEPQFIYGNAINHVPRRRGDEPLGMNREFTTRQYVPRRRGDEPEICKSIYG